MDDADRRRALLVDAYTQTPLSGTPAAVIPDAAGLANDQCRAVVRELCPDGRACVFVEPAVGVSVPGATGAPDGHAAARRDDALVGFHAALHATGEIEAGTHEIAGSASGDPSGDDEAGDDEAGNDEVEDGTPSAVEVSDDGRAWIAPPEPTVRQADVDHDDVAAALGVAPAALDGPRGELPLAVATAHAPWLVVPVGYLQQLGGASPDTEALAAVCADAGAAGCCAFTFDTLGGNALHARQFVPESGATASPDGSGSEVPASGGVAAAVAAYLRSHGAFGDDGLPDELVVEQGDFLDRPGRVHVRTGDENGGGDGDDGGAVGDGIQVGGRGAVAVDSEVAIPPSADDDIQEA